MAGGDRRNDGDFTDVETKLIDAASRGELLDLSRDPDERAEAGSRWTEERTVRATVLRDLLIRQEHLAASSTVRSVRLKGARIAGTLDLQGATLRCSLTLLNCFCEETPMLDEAQAASVRLSGSHLPGLQARQLVTRGDVALDAGFTAMGPVVLTSAHIGGDLECSGGAFNRGGSAAAIMADRLHVDGGVHFGTGFKTDGEVRLIGARIGGPFVCSGATLSNEGKTAINADRIEVDQGMFFSGRVTANGEVRMLGAHIRGQLSCTDCSFSNLGGHAFSADGVQVDQGVFFFEGFNAAGEVRLLGARVARLTCRGAAITNENGIALNADGMTVEEGMSCTKGFTATGEVRLIGADIGGQFSCAGGTFSNPTGVALNADALKVDLGMFCNEGFTARGTVRLAGAHIRGQLSCRNATFTRDDGEMVLNGDGLIVGQDLFCISPFEAKGEVRLVGARVGGQVGFIGATFTNPGKAAINADGMEVNQGLFWREGSTATGAVRLVGARIHGQLSCRGGTIAHTAGLAFNADSVVIDQSAFFDDGFVADGGVRLVGAHIGGQLSCDDARFANQAGVAFNGEGLTADLGVIFGAVRADGIVRFLGARSHHIEVHGSTLNNPGGLALDFERASLRGTLTVQPASVAGSIDLQYAQVGTYVDSQASWPTELVLDGFVYESIRAVPEVPVEQRLKWLGRNQSPFHPQAYEQLAIAYRKAGREDDARRVAIEKQRRRRSGLNWLGRAWNTFLRWTVGYGYRTWQAGLWLLILVAVGTAIFSASYPGNFQRASNLDNPPPFHAFLYAVDVLLPVVNLHQRDSWSPTGRLEWIAAAFTLTGWVLSTAAVLSLSGLLKRRED